MITGRAPPYKRLTIGRLSEKSSCLALDCCRSCEGDGALPLIMPLTGPRDTHDYRDDDL